MRGLATTPLTQKLSSIGADIAEDPVLKTSARDPQQVRIKARLKNRFWGTTVPASLQYDGFWDFDRLSEAKNTNLRESGIYDVEYREKNTSIPHKKNEKPSQHQSLPPVAFPATLLHIRHTYSRFLIQLVALGLRGRPSPPTHRGACSTAPATEDNNWRRIVFSCIHIPPRCKRAWPARRVPSRLVSSPDICIP